MSDGGLLDLLSKNLPPELSDFDTSSESSFKHWMTVTTSHEPPEPPEPPEDVIVNLPPDLADNILWTFPRTAAPNNSSILSSFRFPDCIIAEAQTLAAIAFSYTAQQANGNSEEVPRKNPHISLYYPLDYCHEIIDSMVASIALEQGADVVVLDSLELALGKRGIFGHEISEVVNLIYKPEDVSWEKRRSSGRIQAFMNSLVNIQPRGEAYLPPAPASTQKSKRRIIYIRDFGSIAKSAAPFMHFVLKAIRARMSVDPPVESATSDRIIQPTVLIMGFAKQPKGNAMRRDISGFYEGGGSLRSYLPYLHRKIYHPYYDSPGKFLPPFAAAVFLPVLNKSKYNKDYFRDFPAEETDRLVDELQKGAACIMILPSNSSSPEFQSTQSRMVRERKKRIWNAWITIFLEHEGVNICDDPLSLIHSNYGLSTSVDDKQFPRGDIKILEELSKQMGVPTFKIVRQLISLALNLVIVDHAKTESTEPLSITSAYVSKAYQLLLANYNARSDWVSRFKATVEGTGDAEKESEASVDPVVKRVRAAELGGYESRVLGTIVDIKNLSTSFDDVCIPSNIIESLRTIISLPLLYPTAFKTGLLRRESIGGVLLYGPPGTGKTMVCRALARECKARMLQVKPSDIGDKYVGETEKLVAAIFSLANRLAPCVVFIDEIDALFRARAGDDPTWRRDMLNEFMQAMDGLQSAKQNKDSGVVVVGATNRPYDLDDAILRRMPTRMMVDLPGPEVREQILRVHLADEILHEDVNLASIAKATEYYSGSDLRNLCVSAAMESVKEMIGVVQWNPKERDEQFGQGSDVTAKQRHNWDPRVVRLKHFQHAFTQVLATSTPKSHVELRKWHERFGGTGKSKEKPKTKKFSFLHKNGFVTGVDKKEKKVNDATAYA
ncbi:ATPase family AAA domain-containing protein 1 [Hypsizygus marmoreus]|uniref:ATPase family AAA domain-containing protein 1 n=1 Tax=Hypsizygus marmoreus TaxID=39966 RepID=A0A369K4H7_HYPMA|nr:ATPase family AAA domain-containing protein 1 [Hypsizygus marmoreus]